jgi:hypothetical protein
MCLLISELGFPIIHVAWTLSAVLTGLLPTPIALLYVHEQTSLFYGWYSNRTRGDRKRQGLGAGAGPVAPLPEAIERAPLAV